MQLCFPKVDYILAPAVLSSTSLQQEKGCYALFLDIVFFELSSLKNHSVI